MKRYDFELEGYETVCWRCNNSLDEAELRLNDSRDSDYTAAFPDEGIDAPPFHLLCGVCETKRLYEYEEWRKKHSFVEVLTKGGIHPDFEKNFLISVLALMLLIILLASIFG